jgi:hypothetical protein
MILKKEFTDMLILWLFNIFLVGSPQIVTTGSNASKQTKILILKKIKQ